MKLVIAKNRITMKIINNFLLLILIFFVFACSSREFIHQAPLMNYEGWQRVDDILGRIKEPEFQQQKFNLLDFYNDSVGKKSFVNAINSAIKQCNKSGGGTVIIPAGNYISNGPIHLLSNVNLHLEEGATIKFSTEPRDYTPLVLVRWEGTLCYNYSPLIYAYKQKNIAVTGKGVIDGQTQLGWFKWKNDPSGKNQEQDKKVLRQFGNDVTEIETRVFGHGFLDLNGDGKDDGHGDGKDHYLRPTSIEFLDCENVLIEGLTIRNSPFWNVHPVFCKNVIIRNLNIQKGTTNDDGLDPDSCTDVLIENCTIDTNDDAISIKAGRDQDAWIRPSSENIIIRNNHLTSGVNGFCIGSEMSGGVRNVFVYDNEIPQSLRAINFKCNLDRGGQVEKIYVKNIKVGTCISELFIFRMDYHGYRGNNFPTKFNDFFVADIFCEKVEGTAFKIVGVESQHIERVYLKNFIIKEAKAQSEIAFADAIVAERIKIGNEFIELSQ